MLQVRIHNGLDYTPEPYQCFDFICGTSTGGLVAVLIGRLGKTLDECEGLFRKLGSDIFESSSLLKSSRLVLKGSRHTGESLAEAIRAQAGHDLMYDKDCPSTGHVPVAVVAVSKTTTNDYLFRTYGVRANTEACPIIDACRATSAATTFFPSIMINGVEYVDGAFGKNNPSGAALSELESSEWIAPMQDALQKPSLASNFVPGVLRAIEAAKSCMKIATDCHQVHLEVASRFTKVGANDLYYRFDVDRGLESVALDESDKVALQHVSAVTKAYLRERSNEIENCARMIVPISRAQRLQVTVCSGLPEKSPYFYGRDEELARMEDGLEPSKPGRKAVLLCGIGGSGKTQLVLQYIEQHKTDYNAIIWINASTKESAARSLEEASIIIATQWPADLPLSSNGGSNTLSHVRSRLQHTRHREWLLVLDSLDDPEHHFSEYIPSCNFGSVIVTSTAFRSCFGFRPEKTIEVEGLDTASALSLLNTTSKQAGASEEDETAAKAIIKELSGIPLALEQAGGLISNGEFTFSQFLTSYKTNYKSLMSIRPEKAMWAYEKSRVIITVIDMAIKSLGPDIKYVSLLTMIAIVGPGSLMSDEMKGLHNVLQDHGFLRLALRRLASFSLVRIKEENGQLKSLFLHRIICQWVLETEMIRWKQDCIVFVSYNLAAQICEALEVLPLAGTPKRTLTEGPIIDRKYLAPFKSTLSLIDIYVPDITLNPNFSMMQCLYATVVHHAAWIYTFEGDPEKGRAYFEIAIEMQNSKSFLTGDEEKTRSVSLLHLTGLGQAS
uniref:PNPLA domain-containing protein n=1 Tax=Bionectria ochroleuca TaxID=29856 RepID=A0A8H7N7Y5_BIOOC